MTGWFEDGKIYACTKCGFRSHRINEPHLCLVASSGKENSVVENSLFEVLYQALAVMYEMVAKMLLHKVEVPNSYFNFMEDYAAEIAGVETRN